MFIEKELPVVADNDIDTDITFNAISESILTWENSELINELKLSQAERTIKIYYQNILVLIQKSIF